MRWATKNRNAARITNAVSRRLRNGLARVNSAAAILLALAAVFSAAAVIGIVRGGGTFRPQHRTWLLVAAIFLVIALVTG